MTELCTTKDNHSKNEVKINYINFIRSHLINSLSCPSLFCHTREQTGSDENGLDESFLSSPKVLIGDLKTLVGDSRFSTEGGSASGGRGNDIYEISFKNLFKQIRSLPLF